MDLVSISVFLTVHVPAFLFASAAEGGLRYHYYFDGHPPLGRFIAPAGPGGHEKFWGEPKFFEKLSNQLTPQSKGIDTSPGHYGVRQITYSDETLKRELLKPRRHNPFYSNSPVMIMDPNQYKYPNTKSESDPNAKPLPSNLNSLRDSEKKIAKLKEVLERIANKTRANAKFSGELPTYTTTTPTTTTTATTTTPATPQEQPVTIIVPAASSYQSYFVPQSVPSMQPYVAAAPPPSHYVAPQPQYTAAAQPQSQYLALQSQYMAAQPHPQYLAPHPSHYVTPKPQYVAPQPMYVAPQSQYVKPHSQYMKPHPQYLKPQPQYLKPLPQYVAPLPSQYVTPRPQYVTPRPQYVTPRPQYVTTTTTPQPLPQPIRFPDGRVLLVATPSPMPPMTQQMMMMGSSNSYHHHHQPIITDPYDPDLDENKRYKSSFAKKEEDDTTAMLGNIGTLLETGRKILYLPMGMVDIVDQAMNYAESSPYVTSALGTVADTIFGSTNHTKPSVPLGTPQNQLLSTTQSISTLLSLLLSKP